MQFAPAMSLTEQIADHLGEEIIYGRLAPKERIQELKVARTLGVSRGSVREALLILEGRHLIEILPRRGAVVRDLNAEHVDNLIEVCRELLTLLFAKIAERHEGATEQNGYSGFALALEAMRRAAAESDPAAFMGAKMSFIREGLPLVGNDYLEAVLKDLLPALQRVTHLVLNNPANDLRDGVRFFGALLAALVANDQPRIQELVHAHMKRERKLAACVFMH